jgi:hypothetical protein
MIGWHAGNWHWKVAAAVNIPAGAYQPGELSNLALNRWLGDFSGAITYLNPELGIDLSTAAGLTVNGENCDTHYGTGKELHFEAGVTKHLTRELSVGLIGAEPGGICVTRECATKFGIASITRLAGGFSRVKGNRSW